MRSTMSLTLVSILVAFSVDCAARLRISSATTAKPFPDSPAWAASIAAFIASRLVRSAISWMIVTVSDTLPTLERISWMERSDCCCCSPPCCAVSCKVRTNSRFSRVRSAMVESVELDWLIVEEVRSTASTSWSTCSPSCFIASPMRSTCSEKAPIFSSSAFISSLLLPVSLEIFSSTSSVFSPFI